MHTNSLSSEWFFSFLFFLHCRQWSMLVDSREKVLCRKCSAFHCASPLWMILCGQGWHNKLIIAWEAIDAIFRLGVDCDDIKKISCEQLSSCLIRMLFFHNIDGTICNMFSFFKPSQGCCVQLLYKNIIGPTVIAIVGYIACVFILFCSYFCWCTFMDNCQ